MADVQVFAKFPPPIENSADPRSLFGWEWVHCLTFSVDTLNRLQFTSKPYKWIRYATGVVVGARGGLAPGSHSSCDAVDYDLDFSERVFTQLYYHISNDEKHKMFTADPDMDHSRNTSSGYTPWGADFCRNVANRDGSCILTGLEEEACEAVHLLPHSKGDDHRSRDLTKNDIVDNIDSVWNGVLVNKTARHYLGKSIAFLMTPNFAMTTADIYPDAPPTEKRCTGHVFEPGKTQCFGWHNMPALPLGAPVRMPDTADKWPPDMLFDAVYSTVVLHYFAAGRLEETLRQRQSTFCPGEIAGVAQASHQAIIAKNKKRESRHAACSRRVTDRSDGGDDREVYFDMLLYMSRLLTPRGQMEAHWREAEERRMALERDRVVDKAMDWAKGVAAHDYM